MEQRDIARHRGDDPAMGYKEVMAVVLVGVLFVVCRINDIWDMGPLLSQRMSYDETMTCIKTVLRPAMTP